MTAPILLRTERLTLRPFQDSDEMVYGLNIAHIDNSSSQAEDTGAAHGLAQQWMEGFGI
jgi:hypothetical protein